MKSIDQILVRLGAVVEMANSKPAVNLWLLRILGREVLGQYGKNFTEEIYHNLIGREPFESIDYLIEVLDL